MVQLLSMTVLVGVALAFPASQPRRLPIFVETTTAAAPSASPTDTQGLTSTSWLQPESTSISTSKEPKLIVTPPSILRPTPPGTTEEPVIISVPKRLEDIIVTEEPVIISVPKRLEDIIVTSPSRLRPTPPATTTKAKYKILPFPKKPGRTRNSTRSPSTPTSRIPSRPTKAPAITWTRYPARTTTLPAFWSPIRPKTTREPRDTLELHTLKPAATNVTTPVVVESKDSSIPRPETLIKTISRTSYSSTTEPWQWGTGYLLRTLYSSVPTATPTWLEKPPGPTKTASPSVTSPLPGSDDAAASGYPSTPEATKTMVTRRREE